MSGTFRALEATRNCVIHNYRYVGATGNPSQPPVAASKIDRTLLFQIATGMIADIGISDFRYLTESEALEQSKANAVF